MKNDGMIVYSEYERLDIQWNYLLFQRLTIYWNISYTFGKYFKCATTYWRNKLKKCFTYGTMELCKSFQNLCKLSEMNSMETRGTVLNRSPEMMRSSFIKGTKLTLNNKVKGWPSVIIWTNLVVLECPMLYTMFQGYKTFSSEEDF